MTSAAPHPLTLLQALAHEVRWQIVTELAQSDRRVGELMAVVGRPQNFVSYHLKQLRQAGLVRERRSIADGRDVYYTLDLLALREQLSVTGAHLHPALMPTWEPPTLDLRSPLPRPIHVLFLCTHNSARSQIAEALLRYATHGAIEVFSAGTHPTTLHPLAVTALAEFGVADAGLFAKPLAQLVPLTFEYVITVCDRAREECPPFAASTQVIHWSLPDPLEAEPLNQAPFTATAQELNTRIRFFLSRIAHDWVP
ncbi:MAG: metalloregulator ArsR/SmtB family transcription factor [Ktedonobacterales bacterium]|nr:metalloregulator ArsR/SmtB family transcription factor [Ktedonobacterales bacterium]